MATTKPVAYLRTICNCNFDSYVQNVPAVLFVFMQAAK